MLKPLLIFLLITVHSYGQLNDTTNVSTRWIKLANDSSRSSLFCLDSTKSDKLDFIRVIKDLVEAGKLHLYREQRMEDEEVRWRFINYQNEFRLAQNDSTTESNWRPYFKRFGPESDIPLADEWGEPLVVVGADGYETYVYPSREVFDLYTREVYEIRIKETLTQKEGADRLDFGVSDIGFYMEVGDFNRREQLFWINWEELKGVLKNKEQYLWFTTLENGSYTGFQYKQTSRKVGFTNYFQNRHPNVLKISDSNSYSIPYDKTNYFNEHVIRFPENSPDSVLVYLEYYNSDFQDVYFNTNESTKNLKSYWKVDKALRLYSKMFYKEEKGEYQVTIRGCMIRKREFLITVE